MDYRLFSYMEGLIMDFIKENKRIIIMVLAGICLLVCLYMYHQYREQQLREAVQLSSEQATDINSLQNELQITKANAEQLASEVQKAQSANTQPVAVITVAGPSTEKVVETVTERINNKDASLPAAALEQTDRTVVADQPDNKDYQVGVYKINLNKPHKIKAGFSYVDDKPYINVGYQQNKAELLLHFNEGKIQGGSVMWTIKEW